MRLVRVIPLASLVLLGSIEPAVCRDGPAAGPAVRPAASLDAVPAPPWMVSYEAVDAQPVGVDEADLRTFLEKVVKSKWRNDRKDFPEIWSNLFTLATPAHTRRVPALRVSKYEVTNAQWLRFLEAHPVEATTREGETLEALATRLWKLNPATQVKEIQRGWRTLLRVNPGVLLPVLNPKSDPKWDPLATRAPEQKLPKDLRLSGPLFVPPFHWALDGSLPDAERRRPIRSVTWEQVDEFCRWAGFHLMSDAEFERVARGPEGRWFPWGAENVWDPLRLRWEGHNEALEKAQRPRLPDGPVEVDAMPESANPEGVLHLLGNVAEFSSSRADKYPGSKANWKFGTDTVVARGGSYADKPELLFSSVRSPDLGGPVFVTSMAESLGFRLAAYPVDGADATVTLATRMNDEIRGPLLWTPLPPGVDAKGKKPYLGFDPDLSAGVIQRQLDAESPDHVFVTGEATMVAVLPVKGFPAETTKSVGDLSKHAKGEHLVLLGVLTGSRLAQFGVETPDGKGLSWISAHDERFRYEPPDHERVQTTEYLGMALTWDGSKVVAYSFDQQLNGKAKWRTQLGTFPASPDVRIEKGVLPSVGRLEGDQAVLEFSIPMLDKNGRPLTTGGAFRITVKVPFRNQAPAK